MIEVFEILFPVFALGVIGYGSARLSHFPPEAMAGMTRFIFNIAAPVTVVRVLTSAALPADPPWGLLGSFYIPLMGIYFTMLVVMRRRGATPVDSVMVAFGSTYGNLVLVGFPVMILVFGDKGLVPYFIIMPLHGVALMALTAFLVESYRHGAGKRGTAVLNEMISNPFISGVAVGLVLRHFGIQLTGVVDDLALSLQQALTPCALFTLGVSLANGGMRGALRRSFMIVAIKNLLLPTLVFLLGRYVFDLSPLYLAVCVLTAAQPIGVLYFVFASRFNAAPVMAASAVSLSTTFTLVSLPLLVWLFKVGGFLDG